jgi:hypothetical protein
MSTLKTINITHGSNSGTANIVLDSSGNIEIPDKIIHSGDTNTAIRFSAADTVSIETAGSSRFSIDANGIVTKAVQPAFRAEKTGSTYDHSAGTFPFSNEKFDKNNDYDPSTYTFTAPVDGVYLFDCSLMAAGSASARGITFKKNGSAISVVQWYKPGGSGDYYNKSAMCILDLSASDTVLVYVPADDSMHGGNYIHFSGYLLG